MSVDENYSYEEKYQIEHPYNVQSLIGYLPFPEKEPFVSLGTNDAVARAKVRGQFFEPYNIGFIEE